MVFYFGFGVNDSAGRQAADVASARWPPSFSEGALPVDLFGLLTIPPGEIAEQ
jgi:hypothetical protein